MDRAAVLKWQTHYLPAIKLLVGAMNVINDKDVLDDISLIGRLGNHVIDLAAFVGASVPEPSDPVQKVHWGRLLAFVHAWGMEITHAATVTFDLTPTGLLGSRIAGEMSALLDRSIEANVPNG